jgi:outer membrane protein assembly factor BamB
MQTLDSFQPVPTPFSVDYEFGASPALFDVPDGRRLIAAANKNGYVYTLNRNALAAGVVWRYQISGPGTSPDLGESSIASAAYARGRLFVAGGRTTDGYPGAIAALDPATGSQLWKMHPDGFVLPALAAVGEVVIAGVSHSADNTGRLYVLAQSTGEVLYTYPTPARLFAQLTWANGMLYLVDDGGTLLAFRP